MRTYKSLAIHNSACNEFFYRLQDCQHEKPIGKFFDRCLHLEKHMRACIKEQREINREENFQQSKKRFLKATDKH